MMMPVIFLLPFGIRDCNTYIEGFGFPYILPSYVLSKICTNYSCSMLSLPCIPHLCRINVKIRYCRFLNNDSLGYLNFLASGFWVLKFSALRLSFLQLQDFQLWASLYWTFQIWASHLTQNCEVLSHCCTFYILLDQSLSWNQEEIHQRIGADGNSRIKMGWMGRAVGKKT